MNSISTNIIFLNVHLVKFNSGSCDVVAYVVQFKKSHLEDMQHGE